MKLFFKKETFTKETTSREDERSTYQNKDEGDRGEYQIGRRAFTRYI